MRLNTLLFAIFLLLPVLTVADVPINDDPESKISLYGYIDFETGQIVKARFQDNSYSHLWLENIHGRLGMQYQPFDWLAMRCGAELRVWYNTFPNSQQSDWGNGMGKYFSIYLHEAQGIFKFINKELLSMDMAIGYFPYKYNPEVRDLGEYLFRSGTYPVYLINNFDLPSARLSGLRYTLKYGSDAFGIKFDQLVLTEQQLRPFHDITLASILDVNVFKNILNLGAGISFAHLFSVDDSITTPRKIPETMYLDNGDTAFYTFKGTKLMLRSTIDPFGALRHNEGFLGDFLGSYGGKIYGELAMIGIKNYPNSIINNDTANSYNPYGYDKLNEKMPMMFGFTFPCWKILDVLAFEFEYFNCPYQNDYVKVQQFGYPIPASKPDTSDLYNPDTYKNDNWKWAIFMKKDISKHFGMILQLCRDHQRWEWSGFQSLSYDYEEALVKPRDWDKKKMGEWAWHFKTEFKF